LFRYLKINQRKKLNLIGEITIVSSLAGFNDVKRYYKPVIIPVLLEIRMCLKTISDANCPGLLLSNDDELPEANLTCRRRSLNHKTRCLTYVVSSVSICDGLVVVQCLEIWSNISNIYNLSR